ncbi:MAG: 2-aminoethylphosphonate--pyruvate transaminase [Anaerolineae bacterium]|nr:2-aminoethylphosphonate--pyruvate transaminase [Anaerolineae bacterium]
MNTPVLNSWKDKALFTPGPLTTSRTVKQAMLTDLGSRDSMFINLIKDVRQRLVKLAGVEEEQYTAILVQGSGTYGLESVVSSALPPQGCLLVLINGHYGERMAALSQKYGIKTISMTFSEDEPIDPQKVDLLLAEEPSITHVSVVHCETTTGIINPIAELGDVVRRHHITYIVDAMSSFGAYPLNMAQCGIDYLITSSNKCIEGVPGFSIVLARKETLINSRDNARTVVLDLYDQWQGLEKNGQFRFTPPTHAIIAFYQALLELEQEGGVEARAERYRQNHAVTLAAMSHMGFKAYLRPEYQGYSITSFYYPEHPNFNFQSFYERLSQKGFVIYPGKLTHSDCFRIGHIGRIELSDVNGLMSAIQQTLDEMQINLPPCISD